jgi:hypothetical protein
MESNRDGKNNMEAWDNDLSCSAVMVSCGREGMDLIYLQFHGWDYLHKSSNDIYFTQKGQILL